MLSQVFYGYWKWLPSRVNVYFHCVYISHIYQHLRELFSVYTYLFVLPEVAFMTLTLWDFTIIVNSRKKTPAGHILAKCCFKFKFMCLMLAWVF